MKNREKKRKKIKKEWMSQEKVKFGNGNPPQDQEGFWTLINGGDKEREKEMWKRVLGMASRNLSLLRTHQSQRVGFFFFIKSLSLSLSLSLLAFLLPHGNLPSPHPTHCSIVFFSLSFLSLLFFSSSFYLYSGFVCR